MEHNTARWDRNKVIEKSKKYIKDNLQILKESELKDSIEIIFVDDKKEMYKYTSLHIFDTVSDANKSCVYDENKMPLKHELMYIICIILLNTTFLKYPQIKFNRIRILSFK